MQERLAKLVGGVTVIKVGTATETEGASRSIRMAEVRAHPDVWSPMGDVVRSITLADCARVTAHSEVMYLFIVGLSEEAIDS